MPPEHPVSVPHPRSFIPMRSGLRMTLRATLGRGALHPLGPAFSGGVLVVAGRLLLGPPVLAEPLLPPDLHQDEIEAVA